MDNRPLILEDSLNIRIGNSNKNAKVDIESISNTALIFSLLSYVKANWNNKKVELLLTIRIATTQRTLKLTCKRMQINLSRSLQGTLYMEYHKEQLGKSNSFIEVYSWYFQFELNFFVR